MRKLPALAAVASLASMTAPAHETRAPKCLAPDVLQVFGSVVRNDMAEQLFYNRMGLTKPRDLGFNVGTVAEIAERPTVPDYRREAARKAVQESEAANLNLSVVRDTTRLMAEPGARSCSATLHVGLNDRTATLPITYHAWFTQDGGAGGVYVEVEGTQGVEAYVQAWARVAPKPPIHH